MRPSPLIFPLQFGNGNMLPSPPAPRANDIPKYFKRGPLLHTTDSYNNTPTV